MGNKLFKKRGVNKRDVRQMIALESEGLTPTGEVNAAVKTRKLKIEDEIVDFQKLCKDVIKSLEILQNGKYNEMIGFDINIHICSSGI